MSKLKAVQVDQGWKLMLDLPLDTLTGWTVTSGTWSIVSGKIAQTNTSNTHRRINYDTKLDFSSTTQLMEVTVNFPSAGQGASDLYSGVLLGPQTFGGTSVIPYGRIYRSGVTWYAGFESYTVALWGSAITLPAKALDTDILIRILFGEGGATIWVDGVLAHSVRHNGIGDLGYVYLATYGSNVQFSDLRVWEKSNDSSNLPI